MYNSNSSTDGKIPMSLSPCLRSVYVIYPLASISKILKASYRLKSALWMSEILAFSNSFSREICSLRALTSSSSSSSLRSGCFLIGELALKFEAASDSFNGLALDSLNGELDSLRGVLI